MSLKKAAALSDSSDDPVAYLRGHGVDLWLAEGGRVALTTGSDELVDFARQHKAKIMDILADETYRPLSAESEPVPELDDWFVGVTAAPRKQCTLEYTIAQLRSVGWEPHIFAEPDTTPHNAPETRNDKTLGAWQNWLQAASEGVRSEKPYVLLCQDDISLHPETRYVAEILMPRHCHGFLGLYTSDKYGRKKHPGVHRVRTRSLWGACAIVFPRHVLIELLGTKTARNWLGCHTRNNWKAIRERRRKNPALIANVDTAIGRAMNELRRPMFHVMPSPVQHVARFSTLNHGGAVGNRKANAASHHVSLEVQVMPPDLGQAMKARASDDRNEPLDTVLVTSIAPTRIEHQRQCLDQWRRLGIRDIVAVQCPWEVHDVGKLFPDLFVKAAEVNHRYGLPLIRSIVDVAKARQQPIIVSNADIEPYCSQQYFIDNWVNVPDKTLQWGQRYDYLNDNHERLHDKCKGIDIFRLTPDMEIDHDELCLGMVSWDYWLPYVLKTQQGFTTRTDGVPVFFHRKHDTRHWNKEIHDDHLARLVNSMGIPEITLQSAIVEMKIHDEALAKTARRGRVINVDALTTNVAKDVTIVTCLFHPNKRIIAEYERWLKFLGPMAEHVQCFEVGSRQRLSRSTLVPSAGVKMWQQEPLLNRGIFEAKTKYVAWLDADIVFDDPDWLCKGVDALKGRQAVQLFGELEYLTKDDVVENRRIGAMKASQQFDTTVGAPGGAWIARTDAMKRARGLCSYLPFSGADTVFVANATGTTDHLAGANAALAESHARYQRRASELDRYSVGFVDNHAYHLWHINDPQRQYGSRIEILARHNFDPEVDVRINDEGLLTWSPTASKALRDDVRGWWERRDQND